MRLIEDVQAGEIISRRDNAGLTAKAAAAELRAVEAEAVAAALERVVTTALTSTMGAGQASSKGGGRRLKAV